MLKPIRSKQLFATLRTLQRKYCQSHLQYVENERNLITIPYNNIIYTEFYRSEFTIHTANQVFSWKVKPKETKRQLLDRGFIRTHQGYYVNPNHIKSIVSNEITCSDNSIVPISHRERKNVIAKYLKKFSSSPPASHVE